MLIYIDLRLVINDLWKKIQDIRITNIISRCKVIILTPIYHSIDHKRISHMIYHTEIRSNVEGRGRNMYVDKSKWWCIWSISKHYIMQDTKCILCKVTTKSIYNRSIFLTPLKPTCRIMSIFDEIFLFREKLKQ